MLIPPKSPPSSFSRRSGNAWMMLQAFARAAEACANAGNIEKAIQIVLDVEQGIYEVTTLLNGASLIIRIAKN
jgi:hypothetical protein